MKLSFHVGKAGSQMSQKHNRRELGAELDNRLDPTQFNLNIILIDQDLKDVVENEFGDAIDLYNEKSKPSRKKNRETFLKECEKAAREIIVQVGDADETLTDAEAKEVYRGILDNFKIDNPNLRIFGAYIHLDETTPHMHLDVIPVAHSTRGVAKKASLEGALKEMGFTSDRNKFSDRAFVKWTETMRCQIEQDLRVSGYEIEDHEFRSKEHQTKHREHWEVRTEKALEEAQKINQLVDKLKAEADRERARAHGYKVSNAFHKKYMEQSLETYERKYERIREQMKERGEDDDKTER